MRHRVRHIAVVPVLALAAVLNTWALGQNGYANTFYSAAVKSMLRSWHDFFFVSFDPGGLVTVDKPPLGLWLQAASARLFGFSPLSLLLPEAIASVLAVGVLYLILARRFGVLAGLLGALALAVFPSFVAVSRDNNVDALLILLMVLACAAALRAIESGRLGMLALSAVLVALAFNTKALAAYLVVPGIGLAYLVCAPGSLKRRVGALLCAGLLLAVLSLAWMVAVDATPATQRPFVGGSTDNSEFNLAFAYNGFGRVGGQVYGPGAVPNLFVRPAAARAHRAAAASHARHVAPTPADVRGLTPAPDLAPAVPGTRTSTVVPFGRSPSPARLFEFGLDDQASWMLPFALLSLLAFALTRPARRDPRLAAAIVLGGFMVVEFVVLSLSKGIVHPYYVSALAPGSAAMVGIGAASLVALSKRLRLGVGAVALAATAALQVHLLHREHFLRPWVPALIALAALMLVALLARARWTPLALAVGLGALLVAPAAYSTTLWARPTDGTFPAAGPRAAGSYGGAGVAAWDLAGQQQMVRFIASHDPGSRYALLTESSVTAAAPILLGLSAAALGGYGGVDPALDGPGLGRLVADGQARYVLIGGGYDYLGGNKASQAAERVCGEVPRRLWAHASARFELWTVNQSLYLLDCRGRAGQLERQPA